MKFLVCRTSDVHNADTSQPCNGAVLEQVQETVRTTREQLEKSPLGERWYIEGRNHREEGGTDNPWIMKDVDHYVWTIELPTYGSLITFIHEHGECILGDTYYEGITASIEIYDDYRE